MKPSSTLVRTVTCVSVCNHTYVTPSLSEESTARSLRRANCFCFVFPSRPPSKQHHATKVSRPRHEVSMAERGGGVMRAKSAGSRWAVKLRHHHVVHVLQLHWLCLNFDDRNTSDILGAVNCLSRTKSRHHRSRPSDLYGLGFASTSSPALSARSIQIPTHTSAGVWRLS